MSPTTRLPEIAGAFLKLGSMSFGGPIAHLGYLRDEFVAKRRWVTDDAYADLVALCQFLPGPASSQVVFALGMQRAGVGGALVASLCFTMPSAVLMILFGYGVSFMGDLQRAGWLHGLKLVAVAVVAQAVWGMGRKLCPDRARIILMLVAAAAVLLIPYAVIQISVIAAGAVAGWWVYRRAVPVAHGSVESSWAQHRIWAASALGLFMALLLLLPAIAASSEQMPARVFDSFYRAGSLVFGGGHVVLPLLRAEVVPPGWITDDVFIAGYGAAQAMPGPLFTFAAYLGTVIDGGRHAWLGGLWALFAIFLPAWLLVGGSLPFWDLLRTRAWAQAGLRGANAAVVGVLLAALYNPIWKESVTNARDVAAVLGAFLALEFWRVPPWAVVLIMAAVGTLLQT